MIKHVVFDFDGTIADTAELYIRLANGMSEKYGLPTVSIEELKYLSTIPLKKRFKKLGIPFRKFIILAMDVTGKVRQHMDSLSLFAGMQEVLKYLHQKGFKLYIISSNSVSNIEQFLNNNNIKVFDYVYSSRGLFDKHRTINKLIKKMGMKREEVMYIGDEYRDIKACKKSKVKIISVLWGFDSPELLKKGNPDFLAEKPQDIVDILENIVGT